MLEILERHTLEALALEVHGLGLATSTFELIALLTASRLERQGVSTSPVILGGVVRHGWHAGWRAPSLSA